MGPRLDRRARSPVACSATLIGVQHAMSAMASVGLVACVVGWTSPLRAERSSPNAAVSTDGTDRQQTRQSRLVNQTRLTTGQNRMVAKRVRSTKPTRA